MSEELKPCPFCGGKAEVYKARIWYVECGNNDDGRCVHQAQISATGDLVGRDEAVAAWNRRSDFALAAEKSAREKAEAALAAKAARIADLTARLEEARRGLQKVYLNEIKNGPGQHASYDLDCGDLAKLARDVLARLGSPSPVEALKDHWCPGPGWGHSCDQFGNCIDCGKKRNPAAQAQEKS